MCFAYWCFQDLAAAKAAMGNAKADFFYIAVNKLMGQHKVISTSCASILEKLALTGEKGIDQFNQNMKKIDEELMKPMFVVLANLVSLTALYSEIEPSTAKNADALRKTKIAKCANGLMKAGMRPSPSLRHQMEELMDANLKNSFQLAMKS